MVDLRIIWRMHPHDDSKYITRLLLQVSIPYIQMRAVKIRDSKFGTALVVESLKNVSYFEVNSVFNS